MAGCGNCKHFDPEEIKFKKNGRTFGVCTFPGILHNQLIDAINITEFTRFIFNEDFRCKYYEEKK